MEVGDGELGGNVHRGHGRHGLYDHCTSDGIRGPYSSHSVARNDPGTSVEESVAALRGDGLDNTRRAIAVVARGDSDGPNATAVVAVLVVHTSVARGPDLVAAAAAAGTLNAEDTARSAAADEAAVGGIAAVLNLVDDHPTLRKASPAVAAHPSPVADAEISAEGGRCQRQPHCHCLERCHSPALAADAGRGCGEAPPLNP